ncbi:MAG: hypothetical protein R3277_04395 [Brumimicrobium sp.]|nr:hypothetical protein [Brumimicrobium sp.]
MKYLFFTLVFAAGFNLFSQNLNTSSNGVQYFSQLTFQDTTSSATLDAIEQDLSQNPMILMSRLDRVSGGLFIVTKVLTDFDRQTVESWLGSNAVHINCFRKGLYGVDQVIPFNSQFCSNTH